MTSATPPRAVLQHLVSSGLALVIALAPFWILAEARADEAQPSGAPVTAGTTPATPAFKPPTFADDTVMYVYGPGFRNPFTTTPEQPGGADIARHAIEFKHIDAWKYGHNLVEVMLKQSSDVEPAAGGGSGAVGFYAIFRSGVGINRLAGRPVIRLGPLRDIDLQVGLNLETKNSEFAPAERTLYVGPNFQFRVGQGFVNVGLHLRKEWNHNGDLGMAESYDVNLNIEPVWHLPFTLGKARFAFDGFADFNTAKGEDVGGRGTRPEFITRPMLKLDISPLVGRKAHLLEVGVGFQFWRNMFGKNADRVPGANEFTPVVALAVHLPLGNQEH